MIAFQPDHFFATKCRLRLVLLAFVWCLSLAVGSIFSQLNQDVTVSLMCMAPTCRVSIFGLVITLLFPLLITALAVYFCIPEMIYPILFLKGSSVGYCIFGSVVAFRSAGWLIFSLLTFSELLTVVPVLWLWIHCLSDSNRFHKKQFLMCFFVTIAVGIIDYFFVSPYLAMLMF